VRVVLVGALGIGRGGRGTIAGIVTLGLVIVVAAGLVFPLAALGYSPSKVAAAGGAAVTNLVFRLVAPPVVDRPGAKGVRLPTTPAAVPEQTTLDQLATQAISKAAPATSYSSVRYEDLLKATANKPVHLRGRVWKETIAGSRTVLELDASGNAIDSKPVLVVLPSNASVKADPTREVEISGLYVRQLSAADRYGLNQSTPVVEGHVITQSSKTLFSAY
jgi:hypothetical protein